MLLETVVGMSLMLHVSIDRRTASESEPRTALHLSERQKDAALLPLVQRATECITRRVVSDPRYRVGIYQTELNDLIVDAMSACAPPLRAMIEAHDRMYGRGSGEAFLLGPYLDVLPAAVVRQVKQTL